MQMGLVWSPALRSNTLFKITRGRTIRSTALQSNTLASSCITAFVRFTAPLWPLEISDGVDESRDEKAALNIPHMMLIARSCAACAEQKRIARLIASDVRRQIYPDRITRDFEFCIMYSIAARPAKQVPFAAHRSRSRQIFRTHSIHNDVVVQVDCGA
jgi:hypothetical protein